MTDTELIFYLNYLHSIIPIFIFKGHSVSKKSICECFYSFNDNNLHKWILIISPLLIQVAVTKHKDSEHWSSGIYATMEPFDPVMSFEDFIKDNESIVDQVCCNYCHT